jgi:hypothetical protein
MALEQSIASLNTTSSRKNKKKTHTKYASFFYNTRISITIPKKIIAIPDISVNFNIKPDSILCLILAAIKTFAESKVMRVSMIPKKNKKAS